MNSIPLSNQLTKHDKSPKLKQKNNDFFNTINHEINRKVRKKLQVRKVSKYPKGNVKITPVIPK